MLVVYLLGAFCGLVGAVFLVEPLVRDEENLRPLTTRQGHRSRPDRSPESNDADEPTRQNPATDHGVASGTGRDCPHCGDAVEEGYLFCGTCAGALPTPA